MVQKKKKIGIFDSGIGGLSVLHCALKMIPEYSYLYYADEKHVPYGEKTTEEIGGFVQEIIDFFLKKDVDAIVIACNTATSVATKEYRAQFPIPIIGMEPAIKKAVEKYPHSTDRILVAATPVTIAGDKLHTLMEKVKKDSAVDLVALPELVRFAEKGDFETGEIDLYLKGVLRGYPLDRYKAIVLGCTHFNYFEDHFRTLFGGSAKLMDGNEGTLRQLQRSLNADKAEGIVPSDEVEYFFSGKAVDEQEMKRIHGYMRRLDMLHSNEV